MIKKAIILCVSCKDWKFPKHILIETDGNGSERLDDVANRAFEKYKKTQNTDNLNLLDYTYYGNVEICSWNRKFISKNGGKYYEKHSRIIIKSLYRWRL